jgi:predicted HAD superfamily Cof-like phosphohydrolase
MYAYAEEHSLMDSLDLSDLRDYPETDWQASVRAFHAATEIPIGDTPQPLSNDRLKLRLKLFDEYLELLEASGMSRWRVREIKEHLLEGIDSIQEGSDQDVTEIADALGDIVVVAFGMAIEAGIDLNRVLAEIMRANMSKLDENGKALVNQCPRGGCEQPCMERSHWPRPDEPHGKILKASGYSPPDVRTVLESQEPLQGAL